MATTDVVDRIDACIAAVDLTTTLRDTLATYPGSVHWHLKQGRASGVLEMTYWPRERRVWFSVHRNRRASWIDEVEPKLVAAIKMCLASSDESETLFHKSAKEHPWTQATQTTRAR